MPADPKDVEAEVNYLIETYGDAAYEEAVKKSVRLIDTGVDWAAEIVAEAAINLLQMGYHKRIRQT